jgi:hypothetical protein
VCRGPEYYACENSDTALASAMTSLLFGWAIFALQFYIAQRIETKMGARSAAQRPANALRLGFHEETARGIWIAHYQC